MKCPFCSSNKTRVVDKRPNPTGETTRRRRECLKCKKRFTTYEKVEAKPLMVIKKDGRREPFDRNKLKTGIMKACEKRPVSMEVVEKNVDEIENSLRKKNNIEVPTKLIGELVMKRLKALDKVAYIRFASVYREFKDISDFDKEIKILKK